LTAEVILMRKEVAIISVTTNGRITIPEEVREEFGILNGDKLKVEVQIEEDKKSIVITKI
jgi:AbrB family looped-hinge helix DNA binding protein